jgi:hypothetical protein
VYSSQTAAVEGNAVILFVDGVSVFWDKNIKLQILKLTVLMENNCRLKHTFGKLIGKQSSN